MTDIARRFKENPLLTPDDVTPGDARLHVECLLNPGAFLFKGRTGLLMRVAERPEQKEGLLSFPVMRGNRLEIIEFRKDGPDLDMTDPREIKYRGVGYITTYSHLRLAWSDDGVHFTADDAPTLCGFGPLENYGIEDPRVAFIDGRYYITYTAVSSDGFGVGMMSTADWVHFERHGMIISGPNKDCALFEEKIKDRYFCLHRPSMVIVGGNYIWLAESPDLIHWGRHVCIARTRRGKWDSARVGAGASPILTERGWLAIYHGADENNRYCLGALLLDRNDPSQVLARSENPIMQPCEEYESRGFMGNIIFTNGHILDGDSIVMYYGAADRAICGATLSIREILRSLGA